jgi:hypothetical protein
MIIHLRGYRAHEAPQFIAGSMSLKNKGKTISGGVVLLAHEHDDGKNTSTHPLSDLRQGDRRGRDHVLR